MQFVADFSEAFIKSTTKFNANSQIWIQGFKIAAGREEETSQAVSFAVNSGAKNIAIWGYEGALQESWVACDNPKLVWENICNSIKTCQPGA